MIAVVRTAAQVALLSYDQRRDIVLGEYYSSVRDLRKRISPQRSIDLVMRGPRDVDTAIFASYYLYPRIRRLYQNLDLWRANGRQAEESLLWVDTDVSASPRHLTYLEARRENGRGKLRERLGATGSVAPSHTVILPLACSIDGAPPDEYVVPMVLENSGDSAANLLLSYFDRDRWSERRRITIPAHHSYRIEDVVADVFGRMGIGWLAMESDRSIGIGAALFNRGRGTVSPILVAPPMTDGQIKSDALPSGGSPTKLFVINPGNTWATVDIDAAAGASATLKMRFQAAPHELMAIEDPATRIAQVACSDCAWSLRFRASPAVLLYASRRDTRNETHFTWAEETSP